MIFYAENITGGSNHRITFTASAPSYFVLTAAEYSGIAASGSFDASGSARVNASTYSSGPVTTHGNDELLFGLHHIYSPSPAFTPDTGWSTVQTHSDGVYHAHHAQDRFVPGAGTYASTGTLPGTFDTQSVIVAFRADVPDAAAPSVSITSPADGATVAGAVTIAATASDNVAVHGVQFRIGAANIGQEDTSSPYSVVWNTTTVANGSHYADGGRARRRGRHCDLRDGHARRGQPARHDRPTRGGGSPTGTLPLGTTSTTIALATDESGTCRYATIASTSYADMTAGFTAATGGVAHSASIAGLTNGSTYTFYARCIDALGNANPDDYSITFSVASPDTAPPVISGVSAAEIGPSSARIVWTTDEPSDTQVDYGVSEPGTRHRVRWTARRERVTP